MTREGKVTIKQCILAFVTLIDTICILITTVQSKKRLESYTGEALLCITRIKLV